MAKNPKAVYSSCKLNCEYGAVDASYQLHMNDKHVNVTEYEKYSLRPITYKVSVVYKNDAEETKGFLKEMLSNPFEAVRMVANEEENVFKKVIIIMAAFILASAAYAIPLPSASVFQPANT